MSFILVLLKKMTNKEDIAFRKSSLLKSSIMQARAEERAIDNIWARVSGIMYKDAISSMVYKKETHKQVHLTCGGYGGYNLTFHCDWYAVLDISISYRPSGTHPPRLV